MHPATLQTIGAGRDREIRELAAARRRARQARGAVRSRPARTPVALLARLAWNARPLAGQQRRHGPAAA
jgi:hypothetical protein